MNTEQAFLQAICENPADDTPRLVFADWLEEQDDSASRVRAEFIRIQFALRDLPSDDPLRLQLEERQRDLLLAHEADWIAPLRRQCRLDRHQFRRGFVERVALRIRHFLEDAENLFRLAPVQEIAFRKPDSDESESRRQKRMQQLASVPHLQRLRGLNLSDFYSFNGEEHLGQLLSSMYLNGLTFLSIHFHWLSTHQTPLLYEPFLSGLSRLQVRGFRRQNEQGIESLLRSPRLTRLETLDFEGIRLMAGEWGAIADSEHLNRLKTLRVVGGGLGAEGIRSFVSASGLPALTSLDLSDNELTASNLRKLARIPLLGRLESLSLSMNRLHHDGLAALAASPHVSRLRHLNVSTTRIEPDSVALLANSPHFAELTSLLLRTNRLGDAGVRSLCDAAGLPRLRVLQISYNNLGPEGVQALADAPPGRLATLDLSWNPLTDAAVYSLARSEALTSLAALDLSYAQLSAASARTLAESPCLANLHTLNLHTNRIGDAGLAALAQASGLPRLTALNLGYNGITEAGLRALLDSPLPGRLTALNLAGNDIAPARLSELRREFRGHLGG